MSTGATDFDTEVFPAEIEEIRNRRQTLNLPADDLKDTLSVDNDLHGLALSGGGIRSATFSLGVIQALSKHGILKKVDYLSTVSGGGYIGSCLSTLLNDQKNRPEGDAFPLKYTTGSKEPPALTHLRNSSNFLMPSGLLNKLRLPNLLLRGIIMMLFVFLPFVMGAVFVTEALYELGPNWDGIPKLILPLIALFMLLAIAFPFLVRIMRSMFNWQRRNSYELFLTVPLLLSGVVLMLVPFTHITRNAIEHSTGQVTAALEGIGSQAVWLLSALVMAVIVLFMLAGKASENVSRLRGKIVLLLVGLLGPGIIFSIYILLCLWQINSPFLPAGSASVLNDAIVCQTSSPNQAIDQQKPCLSVPLTEKTGGSENDEVFAMMNTATASDNPSAERNPIHLLSEIVSALFTSDPAPTTFAQFNHVLHGRNIKFKPDAIVRCVSPQPCTKEPVGRWRDDERQWLVIEGWQAANDTEDERRRKLELCPTEPADELKYPLADLTDEQRWIKENCTYFSRVSARSLRIDGAQLGLFTNTRDFVFVSVFFLLFFFNRFLLDINITSPHGFYRDRLSKAFIFDVSKDNEIEQADDIKLSELGAPGSTAPYHLINVALNLQGCNEAGLRGRMSDLFEFSKHYCGSLHTGYAPTLALEKYDKHLDLATAMAISGAAAAPNMGTTTSRSLTFIMTLLNIRLGYWLPNPVRVNRQYWRKWYDLRGARPKLIWKEALGFLDARGSHVNVSDGGHVENLGIYPLLKRRCKYILAVDGEADPTMTFGGLVTLMRLARIDMGIEIEMNLDDLRKSDTGFSKAHWSTGIIRYGNGEIGHLVYIKLSVSGDEPEYIRAYRDNNVSYPHESTADQFFSEEQFEAYRSLGEHVGEGALKDIAARGGLQHISDVQEVEPDTSSQKG